MHWSLHWASSPSTSRTTPLTGRDASIRTDSPSSRTEILRGS